MESDLPFYGDFPSAAYCIQVLDAQVPFDLWMSDPQGRVRPLSPAFLEVAGVRLEPSGNPAWSAKLEPGEAGVAEEVWRRCLAAGGQWEHEFRLASEDGRVRHVLSRGTPALDATGRIRAWVGLNLDVTGIREGNHEVRRFRERVLMALSTGGDYLYEVDLDAGTRRWFGPAEDLLGCAAGDFPATEAAWVAAIHPKDRPAVAEARGRHAESRVPYREEYRFQRRDGGIIRLLDRGRRIPGADGHPGFLIGIVTDLSSSSQVGDPVRAGEEGRRSGQRLEVIGRLAGGIAHDFNNLLTAINGFSELLVNTLENPSQVSYAKEILRAGERAALITRQLLAFSRRQILAPRVLDLNALTREIGRALPGLLGGKLDVVVRTDPQGALIKADPSQVEQVFLNLASNALQSMPEGGRLTLGIGRADWVPGVEYAREGGEEPAAEPAVSGVEPGPYVVITVEDQGEGMDEEERSHLFEPFFTAHGRPHGLGLSAVYGIVKQNGGHIVACSREGEGTIFRIHWPRWTGSGMDIAAPGTPGSRIVLVAEDEEVTRDMVRDVLEREGFHVITAASGQEALDVILVARRPPDLLLTDVVMPGMGGLELAGRLHPARPDMKVLFMSGYPDHHLVRQGIMAAGRPFIRKPFAPGDLVSKIQSVLSIRQAA